MTGIFLYLRHVADLLDRCFEREAMLHAHDMHSFAPLLRFEEQLAASPEELAEHRAFLRDRHRHYILPDKEADAAFVVARDEARRRATESGNIWESEMTALGRRRMMMGIQQSEQFQNMFAFYENECATLFEGEVQRFSTERGAEDDRRGGRNTSFKAVLGWLARRNTAFCKAVLASREAVAGLTWDRRLATRDTLTFSKVLARHWKVSIHIDGQNLNHPFGGVSTDSRTGKTSHLGPWVDAWIGIRPLKPTTEELKRYAMLRFEWIFPVPTSYHFMCRDLRELEATIRIYIEMFRLIEPELEAALVRESADRAA